MSALSICDGICTREIIAEALELIKNDDIPEEDRIGLLVELKELKNEIDKKIILIECGLI